MKKVITSLIIGLVTIGLQAQNNEGASIVTTSEAKQEAQGESGKYTFQVGLPFVHQNTENVVPYDTRFPWDILYLYGTFAEESFDVSKGYFSDKVLIQWELRNNFDLISNIKIYRREYLEPPCDTCWDFQANVSPEVSEWEDAYTEGGVLYEYKVLADGVNNEELRYLNFISGIGFRNPTATITGNINYKGGNPVKDVTVRVNSQGSTENLGSSLFVPSNKSIDVRNLSKGVSTKTTLQAWIKPNTPYTGDNENEINIFNLNDGIHNFPITILHQATSRKLLINVDGNIIEVNNFIPSGDIDSRGNDVLVPIEDFGNVFTHFSFVISDVNIPKTFINGREMNDEYLQLMRAVELPNQPDEADNPYVDFDITNNNVISNLSVTSSWENIAIGGGRDVIIDEIRVWNDLLDEQVIRTDYRRYLSGNDARFVTYLRANEGVGNFAYDFSRSGFTYNKNHGIVRQDANESNPILWSSGAGNVPSTDQLGVLGVTTEDGNYVITGIPYSGTGESFTVTPLFGLHQFEPNQQIVFLGQGSEVVNQINFTDISSFNFKGKILYDVRGVFSSFAEVSNDIGNGNTVAGNGAIRDEGYNQYDILGEPYRKGEYWLNDAGTPDDITDDYLDKYALVPLAGAHIYVDGQIVLDENNQPVTSDDEGNFDISVPIGNHFVRVEKQGHEFVYNGRFPAETGTYHEFFENSEEQVVFIDTTRVTVVGRVVGGGIEAQKPIGFGAEGTFIDTYLDADFEEQNFEVSSINNIGVANFVWGYKPVSGNITPYTQYSFSTNIDTGEYSVEVMPLIYLIDEINGLNVPNSLDNIDLLSANETLSYSDVPSLTIPEYEMPDGSINEGIGYHYEKSFTYRSTPTLAVTRQSSDLEIEVNDSTSISTASFDKLIFSQFAEYEIEMEAFERYLNYDTDSNNPIEYKVPLVDGELSITNNLALEGTEVFTTDTDNPSNITYTFQGGTPNVFVPFTKTIDIQYLREGQSFPADPATYKKEGIVLGGEPDGSQSFITKAPDIPDIILRDPPGTNSYATIEAGESISFTVNSEVNSTVGIRENISVMLGAKIETGGGITGPIMANRTINSFTGELSLEQSSRIGKELTKTYTFNQSISTSGDKEFVGSEGDLYIGNSVNFTYGTYDNLKASKVPIPDSETLALGEGSNQVFLSIQKGLYLNPEPTNTFFVYSQKFLLENLIPELEQIVFNIENGLIPEEELQNFDTKEQYEEQIRLWRLVIHDNEKSKSIAFDRGKRDELRLSLTQTLNNYTQGLENAINDAELVRDDQDQLIDNLNNANVISNVLNDQFEENISFDAGVGEVTRSVETIVVDNYTKEFRLELHESIGHIFGYSINTVGVVNTVNAFADQDLNASLTESESTTTKLSYTLKDNDPANFFSIDVINAFDGNGPIFSTIGGRTSCPYEGAEKTLFYNENYYQNYLSDLENYLAQNPDNPDDPNRPKLVPRHLPFGPLLSDGTYTYKQENLSNATLPAEEPNIEVEVAEVFNIPESNKAEYKLLLRNLADVESDAANINYFSLFADNTTNPHNAKFNLALNGTTVYVPYGQTVEFTLTLEKSVSDIYDYENIRIVLWSLCDPINVYDDIYVSAHFVPSCTEVTINDPLNNWVFNREIAYNNDGTTNTLPIVISEYDTTFGNFRKIDLEYRLKGSPTWTRLETYYNTQEYYDEAEANGETSITLIDDFEVTHAFDVLGLQLQDGNYELRARSSCNNGTEYISEIIEGRVDLNAPQRFEIPSPTDGILDAGDVLKASFNEPIFYNSAVSTVEIKGETNQLPIDHTVSVYFNGQQNTMEIQNPRVLSGNVSVEFWMNNATTSSNATIINQLNGIQLELLNGELNFNLGQANVRGAILNDGLFHHYVIAYNSESGDLQLFEDDRVLSSTSGFSNLPFINSNPLVIGGNTFVGNIHDLRIWSKTLTLSEAYANRFNKIIGNERNLKGFWPMNEGRGTIAHDLAFFKNGTLSAEWDIKPKGESYEFMNNQYLELDNVSFVQLTNEMDATLSLWVKSESSGSEMTIFSNGRGNGEDVVQSNGNANKWALSIASSGQLVFDSEGNRALLSDNSITDNNWHHIALLLNRNGSLRTYIDGELTSSNDIGNVGGFSGSKIWLGARGLSSINGQETVDQYFTGKIDEVRLWNSLRNIDQIKRDQYHEIDLESIGLMLYSRFNTPDPPNNNGPKYYHAFANQTIIPSDAVISAGNVSYSEDVPPIKPARNLIRFQVDHVINDDEIILEPVISDWAVLEGQILDVTVHRMFDSANNMQESAITWTAYVQKNDVSWYADGFDEVVSIVTNQEESTSFNIILVNRGGNVQPYSINNIPSWLNVEDDIGTIPPNTSILLTATINDQLGVGQYLENLYLQTDFGFDQLLPLDVRVLAEEPDWALDENSYEYSMNIVGKIKVDQIFSSDSYDKVVAFVGEDVRGIAKLFFDENYQEHFVFLTIYSNQASGEQVQFKIWDASEGKVLHANIDSQETISFSSTGVLGSLVNPVIFENTNVVDQTIVLNEGWTWVSFNVNDSRFSNLASLTSDLVLNTEDRMIQYGPTRTATYTQGAGWFGSIVDNGGVSSQFMYKIKLKQGQEFMLEGSQVNASAWSFEVNENWNWLPYPLDRNVDIDQAMANYNASEGDVVKSQTEFAIYDQLNGWSGTLSHLEPGVGYMLNSQEAQEMNFPVNVSRVSGVKKSAISKKEIMNISYANNMNAVVQLPEGYNKVLAYDEEGRLRGKATNRVVGDKKLSFITISGDNEIPLRLYMGNTSEEKPSSKWITYKSNEVLGTVQDPIVLEEISANIQCYPNPFTNHIMLEIKALKNQLVDFEINDVLGRKVFSQSIEVFEGLNQFRIPLSLESATYMAKVKVDGNEQIIKIIKK